MKKKISNYDELAALAAQTKLAANVCPIEFQPKNVLIDYIHYVDGKADIEEVPMCFEFWAGIEIENNSPISKSIELDN
jgi:hypothetical protein